MVQLQIARDFNLVPLYAMPIGDANYTCSLLADTATSLVVPANARIAVFGYSTANDYWVGTSTFTIPTINTFSAQNIYLNPPPLVVAFGQTLWFRAPVACTISVAFYS